MAQYFRRIHGIAEVISGRTRGKDLFQHSAGAFLTAAATAFTAVLNGVILPLLKQE